ncbi:MAG: acetate--CoA ligase family protein [Bacteroidia bacterium]|nr:acetate--CoA ligase family protein [Bacteroidia bacterium]
MEEKQMSDFYVHKFYSYTGPNLYLDRKAMVFNLYIDPEGQKVEYYDERVTAKFPSLKDNLPGSVVDLFAKCVVLVNKMDMNLFVEKYNISRDGEEWVIAFEHMDDKLAKKVVYFVSDWFISINENNNDFDFDGQFADLQAKFDKSLYGGPTLYSIIEAGVKRKINVHYLYEENQFQWGYGKKQIRGRSTIFHIDGIKDTEFTMYKDMVGEFLEMCGFPTPKGKNCYDEDELVEEALKLGWPVVVKPVAGHKGQGVKTGIESEEEVRKQFNNITKLAQEQGTAFEGALVQQQIYGWDHRILCVGQKYAACLKRIPAYVIGNGKDPISELIRVENEKEERIDNARSPLGKIKIDEDLIDYLKLRGMTVDDVPAAAQEVVLRRVANISAGGVSINVTKDIHPDNILMVESIAKFLNVTCLGIDALSADISKPWYEGNFGIIEINAGPGVFMHLTPAEGGSVDVPGIIMEHLFGKVEGFDRVPIIAANKLSSELIARIYEKLKEYKKNIEFGSLRLDGAYFNEYKLVNNPRHDSNCQIVLRNPKLDIALFCHEKEAIHDFGIWHHGCDIAILDHANYVEYILERDLLPGGILIEVIDKEITETETQTKLYVLQNGKILQEVNVQKGDTIDDLIFNALSPYLKELLFKYDYYLKLENRPEDMDMGKRFIN